MRSIPNLPLGRLVRLVSSNAFCLGLETLLGPMMYFCLSVADPEGGGGGGGGVCATGARAPSKF